MSWRTVVIANLAKLDLCMNTMEVRGDETRKIHLSELHTLIIENTAVSLTSSLLCELMKRKVKVIFCDEKRNPQSELLPYYGSHDTTAKLRQQIAWKNETKALVWAEIVAEKIHRQQALLRYAGQTERAELLAQYAQDVRGADTSNREGHAAKVYFGGIFGSDFIRAIDSPINASLNYGYSILLSAFNREIAVAGYLTQLGIFHDNMFNAYNLGCDLMEPFRPLVDRIVLDAMPTELDKDMRRKLQNLLNDQVEIDGSKQYISAAIRIYTYSVLEALNQNSLEELRFYTLEWGTGKSRLQQKLEQIPIEPYQEER